MPGLLFLVAQACPLESYALGQFFHEPCHFLHGVA